MKTLLRTISGFIIDNNGKEWLVGFVVDNEVIKYRFNNKKFRKARVRCVNQPFELREFEEGGEKSYEIKALAEVHEAVLTKLDLGPEYEEKLQSILSHFR